MEKSLRVHFKDDDSQGYNTISVINYEELYRWLTNNSEAPFVVLRTDQKKDILYKNSIKKVEVFVDR